MSDAGSWAVRPCTTDDVQTVLTLVRADEERVSGRPSRLVEGDVRDWWQTVDLAKESWLLVPPASDSGSGSRAGSGSGSGSDSGAAVGVVWLDRQGAGLAACFPIATDAQAVPALVDLAEGRAVDVGLERLHVVVLVPDRAAEELLTARGYREVRRFYDMAIELEAPPSPVDLPDGFSLGTATPEDGPAFHATITEAFEDHWESHPLPYDEWWRVRTGDPDFDISWWFTVRDGDEVVAAVRNVPARNGGVYVAALGVRRTWRGRGLAKALLQHTFARAYEAGFPRITLGVDATNPTGATALYRRVGMTVEHESAAWEKHLRQDA
jgi:ribosomal protein S18 acetylase RimI-like enzyme